MKTKKISILVDPEEFARLNECRAQRRTTFQAVGLDLFRRWATGTVGPPEKPFGDLTGDEDRYVRALLAGLRNRQIEPVMIGMLEGIERLLQMQRRTR